VIGEVAGFGFRLSFLALFGNIFTGSKIPVCLDKCESLSISNFSASNRGRKVLFIFAHLFFYF